MHKYNIKIELLKNFTTASRIIDLDNDSYTEELTLGNIDKDNFYGEVWNSKALLGVMHDKDNVLKSSMKIQDLDKDSITDYCYLSCYNDTLFLKRSDIRLKNNKILPSKKEKVVICPLVIKDAQPECFKIELMDVDGDSFEDYIFTIFHSPKHRCIYYYSFKKKKLYKSNSEFMAVTDFQINC